MNSKKILILKCEEYFKKNATGFSKRKSIDEIQRDLNCDNRTARDIIYELKKFGFRIVADLFTGGYFLVDKHSKIDVEIAYKYYNSQRSRAMHIFDGIKCFKSLFPECQLELEKIADEVEIKRAIEINKKINLFFDDVVTEYNQEWK